MKKVNVVRINYFFQFLIIMGEEFLYIFFPSSNIIDIIEQNILLILIYLLYGIIVPVIFYGRTPLQLVFGIYIVNMKQRRPSRLIAFVRGVFYPLVLVIGSVVVFFAGLWVKDWPFDVLFGTRMVRINKDGRFVYARRTFEAEL